MLGRLAPAAVAAVLGVAPALGIAACGEDRGSVEIEGGTDTGITGTTPTGTTRTTPTNTTPTETQETRD
jgi:hypothetical protein